MDNISHNKLDYLKQMKVSVDVKKSNDVLGKDTVRAKDILSGKKDMRINKMSDVFPQPKNNDGDVIS